MKWVALQVAGGLAVAIGLYMLAAWLGVVALGLLGLLGGTLGELSEARAVRQDGSGESVPERQE